MAQYSTGELAKLANVSVRTVQFYDEKGLLKPSDVTEGGRRLYSEKDAAVFQTIVFLKDLGFSLKDIAAILSEKNPAAMLSFLMDEQEVEINATLALKRQQLKRIRELREQVAHMNMKRKNSISAIATVMGKQRIDNKKRLRNMRISMILVGIFMDAFWIGGLVWWIVGGVWVPFLVGMILACLLGVLISLYYYHHVAYVCPTDNTIFRPPFSKMFFARHTPSTRNLTCPTCGEKHLCLEIYVPEGTPERIGKDLVWK